MQFLTWEHPMVMAAIDLTLSSETGNASVSIVKHPQLTAGQFILEIIFIIECSAPAILQAGRFLPPTPVRVLIDQEGRDLSQKINHGSLVEVDTAIEKEQITEFLIGQKKHINTLLETGKEIAGEVMKMTVRESTETMLEVMSNEIKRLVRLKKINPGIKHEEIEYLQNMTRELNTNIQEARLKMDAVRFLIAS
jgi:ATP-dependent helicase HepA